jgi:hypothetical protein
MNAIQTISPYRHDGLWVFDDPAKEVEREPFVAGADLILDALAGDADRIRLLFSDGPFPGATLTAELVRHESGGVWYRVVEGPAVGSEGWLCPVLLRYFPTPPDRLYVEVRRRR